ncbi:hypothetical protein RAS2_32070 [Phycisphaerae bacterium RAS2]|nr:hypothetical protein RAS2_32070 [Phycisphaerae bacterium RAS2]
MYSPSRGRLILLAACAAIGFGSVSHAGMLHSISFSDVLTPQPTSFSRNLVVPRFDDQLGELQSIDLSFTGNVLGTARFESLNPNPRDVVLNLSAHLEIRNPDQSLLTVTNPIVSIPAHAGAFDGVIDFGGSSGATFPNLQGQVVLPLFTLTDPAALDQFVGSGTLAFPVHASATSFGSGPGNIIYSFSTLSAASMDIIYRYEVPEPSAGALLAAFATVTVLNRSRRSLR